jgi:hypothetical protein
VNPRKRFNSDRERQTARRVRNQMRGLNTQGKPYQRHPNFINRAETWDVYIAEMKRAARRHALARKLARYHRIAAANQAKGLRVDGKPFRRHPNFHSWKNFRQSLPAGQTMNWEMIER